MRYAAFTVFALSSAVALASWVVRARVIPPFSHAARLLRRISDPMISPIERRLHQRGGNPVNAPWWLFGTGLVSAILLVSVTNWLLQFLQAAAYATGGGPKGLFWFAVHGAGQLLVLALLLRVLGSWFGIGRYTSWMRPAYILTDWIVEPLRRVLPPMGMFDVSPLVAWFLIQLVLRALPR